eukprot:scaffold637_cov118-Isochrysis_galbana.AAC.18
MTTGMRRGSGWPLSTGGWIRTRDLKEKGTRKQVRTPQGEQVHQAAKSTPQLGNGRTGGAQLGAATTGMVNVHTRRASGKWSEKRGLTGGSADSAWWWTLVVG